MSPAQLIRSVFFLVLALWSPDVVAVRASRATRAHTALRTRVARAQTALRSKTTMHMRNAVLTSPAILLITSPMEMKVCYVQVSSFRAIGGSVQPLIDSGLMAPYGIAYDMDDQAIFVTDVSARKIFYYKLAIEQVSGFAYPYRLSVVGERKEIRDNVNSKWVSVYAGELYYSDEEAKTINKISKHTIGRLVTGQITSADLISQGETTGEALAEASASANLAATNQFPENSALGGSSASAESSATQSRDDPLQMPVVVTLYQASANPHVGVPGGLVADGVNLFWVNAGEGTEKGTVVQGEMVPEAPANLAGGSGAASFETFPLANNSAVAYGIAETYNMLVYTSGSTEVYGISRSGGAPITMTRTMEQARGVVWDGDGTVYIADQAASTIYSMPCGRMSENLPMDRTVDFHDAYGLAILHPTRAAPSARSGSSRSPEASKVAAGFVALTALLISLPRA